jgi:HTH-type transcriptional regulator / antitoxin HipB
MKTSENNLFLKSFEEHLTDQYGVLGTPKRDSFEEKAKAFVIAEMLREERLKAHLTQEQLAEKIGAKKGYISRIENGKTDIQITTLFRIVEKGFGKRLNLSFF